MSAPTDLDHVLARHHVGVSSEEFVRHLDQALSTASSPDAEPLSLAEVGYLRAHGGKAARDVLDDDPQEIRHQRALSILSQSEQVLAASMSIAETADLLGVGRSRVSQLLSGRRLWAFALGERKRIPRWQFEHGTLLPNLSEVIAAIPAGLSPQSIAGLMTTEQPELGGQTPVEFLATGGDPHAVAELVAGLGQW